MTWWGGLIIGVVVLLVLLAAVLAAFLLRRRWRRQRQVDEVPCPLPVSSLLVPRCYQPGAESPSVIASA